MAAILIALSIIAVIWFLSRDHKQVDDGFAWLAKNPSEPFEVSAVIHGDLHKIAVDRTRRKIAFVNVDMQGIEGFDGKASWGGGRSKNLVVVTGFDNVKALRLRDMFKGEAPVLDITFHETPRPGHYAIITFLQPKQESEFLQRELGLPVER